MRKYETIFISDPDLNDQNRSDLFEKVRNIISKENGLLIDFDEWGNKKLAYEIRKKSRGHYVCLTYGGDGTLVDELERNFRLTDDVLKFMTIVLSEDMTVQALEEEAQALNQEDEPQEQPAAESEASEPVEQEKEEAVEEASEEKADTPNEEETAETAEPQKETE